MTTEKNSREQIRKEVAEKVGDAYVFLASIDDAKEHLSMSDRERSLYDMAHRTLFDLRKSLESG